MLRGPSLESRKIKPTDNFLSITDHDFDNFRGERLLFRQF